VLGAHLGADELIQERNHFGLPGRGPTRRQYFSVQKDVKARRIENEVSSDTLVTHGLQFRLMLPELAIHVAQVGWPFGFTSNETGAVSIPDAKIDPGKLRRFLPFRFDLATPE
jgi:hypothetical protein